MSIVNDKKNVSGQPEGKKKNISFRAQKNLQHIKMLTQGKEVLQVVTC